GEGRGRRTTDDIRLMIHGDPDEIEAKARGNGDDGGESGAEPIEADPVRGTGSSAVADPVSRTGSNQVGPPVGTLLAPSVRTGPNSEPEPEDSPPYPPPGGGLPPSGDGEEGKTWPGCDMWPDFERAWSEPILRQSIARQVWSALTEEERRLAIKAARGYVIHRRSQKKPPNTIIAHTFLRERDAWVGFAALAPPEPRRTEKITITEGSAAGRGLSVIKRIWERPMPNDPVDVETSAIPALESLARLATAAERCVITESDNRAQVAAWRERLAKCGF